MMKLFSVIACALVGWIGAAAALDQASIPSKFPIEWGASAGSAYIRNIPQASQIGVQNCGASLTDGFPPLTFVPAAAGGCPPFGQDMNGILRQISQWSRWQGAGAQSAYDASFSSSISGYPSGATLANASTPGCFWVSRIDNNTSNPDSGGSNWNASCPGGGIGGASGGSANTQTVTGTPMVIQAGATISFIASFQNTGPVTVNYNGTGALNVYRLSQLGATMSVGGEFGASALVTLKHDGTRWQCQSCAVVRVGKIEDFVGQTSNPPAGTLYIDGTCQSQTTFADLYAVMGIVYAVTSGACAAGTFRLPDGRSTTMVGNDAQGSNGAANRITGGGGSSCAANFNGVICGQQNRTLLTANLPPYTPSGTIILTRDGGGVPFVGTSDFLAAAGFNTVPLNAATLGAQFSGTAQGGASAPLGTLPPLQVVWKIIQY